MGKLIGAAAIGLALLSGGCATGGTQTSVSTKTERWTCPAGTRPDARIREPNCAIAEPVAQAQAETQQEEQKEEQEEAKEEKTAQLECPPAEEQAGEEIQFEKRVSFAPAKVSLVEPSKAMLDDVAQDIQNDPEITKVRVDGHADSTGSPAMNEELAAERAQSVKNYLQEQGVPEEIIEVRSYSDSAPFASNDTPDGRAINRSVVIVALK